MSVDLSTQYLGFDLYTPLVASAGPLTASVDGLQRLADAEGDIAERVQLIEGRLQNVELTPDDVVVSAHACGRLSDVVVDRAIEAGASVAVLPCCHAHGSKSD